ncbi:MAG: hypothetical protein ORN52_09135 [Beijerinckiaceae bacterium]|nr:hypothetical protein [Beijerinckiaceae bacterium]
MKTSPRKYAARPAAHNLAAPSDVDQFFPLPHCFSKEDEGQFRALRQHIMASVEPENFLERAYANEMAHLLWQVRLNQARIESLTVNASEEGLVRLLTGRCDDLPNLIKGLRRRDHDAVKTVEALLKDFNLTQVDIDAHAHAAIASDVLHLERDCDAKRDQFDRLVQNFEKRRFLIAERISRLAEMARKEIAPPPPPMLENEGD